MIKKGIYKHYKNKLYEVIDIAIHTESMEKLVVYRALYGDFLLWVRPLSMFCENIELEGKQIPRFMFINESSSSK